MSCCHGFSVISCQFSVAERHFYLILLRFRCKTDKRRQRPPPVKAAQKAFENTWGNLHPTERGKYLRAIADQLRQNAEHLGRIETIDTGKLYRETYKQANYIAEYYDYYAGLADKVEPEKSKT